MMKQLYLHIGIGKTGTTSIQKMLSKHRELLLERGYLYPTTGTFDDAHHFLADFNAKTFSSDMKQLYISVAEEFESADVNNLVLSSEQFCYCKHGFIENIRSIFDDFDVRVIFYVRQQLSLIPSAYLQKLKQGTDYIGTLYDFFQVGKTAFQFSLRIKAWEELFGRENLIVKVYDHPPVRENLCHDFLESIGISGFDLPEIERHNPSISPILAELIPIFDSASSCPNLERERYIDALMRVSESLPRQPAKSMLTRDIECEIKEFYLDTNREFAERYLNSSQASSFLWD